MITAKGIKKAFPVAQNELFWALKGIDLHIPQGKLTLLKGRSGSGKTTLMNILGQLDDPTEGEIFFQGENVTDLSEAKKSRIRRNQIGFVFQSVALIPMMTAFENIEFILRMANYDGDKKARAEHCLKMVGLANRRDHLPQQLSGGEQQRVAIARAFAHQPKVLFADEPTAELDTDTGLQVMKIFKDLCAMEGITVVMTTHDVGLMEIADVSYELEDGEIIGR